MYNNNLTVHLKSRYLYFYPTNFFFFLVGKQKDWRSFHWSYIFRKVKLTLCIKIVIVREVEAELLEVVFAYMLGVFSE